MMYGVKYCRFARSLASAVIQQPLMQKSYKRFLFLPESIFFQTANRKYYNHLWQKKKTLLPNLKQVPFNENRFEYSSSGENISSSDASLVALRQELSQMRAIGKNVPEIISDGDLQYYGTLTSITGKKKFLNFLVKREGLRKREKLKKVQKFAERRKDVKDDDIEGTMPINKLFRRISAVTMLTNDNWRLASAMKFGPQIAYDFSFDDHMARREMISMISQLTHVLNANKAAKDPFYMHWTGLKDGSSTLKEMRRMFGENFQNIMVNSTDQDVINLFPPEKLIYLTADSANIMHTFDEDRVYIVGGLVDAREIQTGVTLAKAKRHNISHARLPLDLYLQWEVGAKTLTLDQVARILHTMHATQDWIAALKNVPTRKHGGFKTTHQLDGKVLKKVATRPHLEKYYQRQKDVINKGRERKETVSRDNARFSFSRAKQEFKWDILNSEDADQKSNVRETTEVSFDEENDADFDPTNDTLYSFSKKIQTNQKSKMRKKGSKWFQN